MQAYEKLEVEWAEFNQLDPKGMVACSSGTAALHLALEAFRLPQGSQVIVPDYTMIACPRAVSLAGLEPVFVDCDNQLLMDLRGFRTALLTSSTPYIAMFVHVYGRQCDLYWMNDAPQVVSDYNNALYIVEDLAEAHGVRPHPYTDAACFSFYKNKIVAGEEGGAVWFRNPEHAALARQLRSLGFTDAHDYTHIPRGHNYRLANCLAEKILESIRRAPLEGTFIDQWDETWYSVRREIERWYDDACRVEWRQPKRDAVWVYDLRIKGMTCETQRRVVDLLRKSGIEARYGFKPCTSQPEYINCKMTNNKNAYLAAREVIYLPVQPGVTTKSDCQRSFDIIRAQVGA